MCKETTSLVWSHSLQRSSYSIRTSSHSDSRVFTEHHHFVSNILKSKHSQDQVDYQVSSISSKVRFRLDFQSLFMVKNSKVCRQDPWMTIKLLELHVCLWNRLETSAGPPAPYRRRSTFKSVQAGWTALAGKAMEATFGAPTQWCESCSFYTVRGDNGQNPHSGGTPDSCGRISKVRG